jgi:hypothetical protein
MLPIDPLIDTVPYYTLPATAHRLTLGARPLAGGPLIEIDRQAYAEELALKQEILGSDYAYYFQAQPQSEQAQWEALALILHDLCSHYPEDFALRCAGDDWMWRNRLLGASVRFRFGDGSTLPWGPLDWVGRQVQEDLLLLDGSDSALRLMAGQLCFPNRWSLDEKMGLSFLAIHEPVPGFGAEIGRSSNLLLAQLKAGRPVWRYNWSLTVGGELDHSTRAYAAVQARMVSVTAANCGESCFLRAERQTLARLPRTGAVLFTVHTYRTALANLASDQDWARRFLEVLEQASPALLAYKGVAPIEGALREYLVGRASLARTA